MGKKISQTLLHVKIRYSDRQVPFHMRLRLFLQANSYFARFTKSFGIRMWNQQNSLSSTDFGGLPLTTFKSMLEF